MSNSYFYQQHSKAIIVRQINVLTSNDIHCTGFILPFPPRTKLYLSLLQKEEEKIDVPGYGQRHSKDR